MFYSVEPVLPIRLFARYLYLGKSKSKLTILVCTQCSNKVQLTLHTEKAMASHSSTFAWKIPWTEEPGGLPGDLPDPGMEPRSPALQADTLPSEPPGERIRC